MSSPTSDRVPNPLTGRLVRVGGAIHAALVRDRILPEFVPPEQTLRRGGSPVFPTAPAATVRPHVQFVRVLGRPVVEGVPDDGDDLADRIALARAVGFVPFVPQRAFRGYGYSSSRSRERSRRRRSTGRGRSSSSRPRRHKGRGKSTPADPPGDFRAGVRRRGKDGRMWVVRANRRGTHTWHRAD